MPKAPATPEEVESVKNRIIDESISLINEIGFSNFSMRKLGNRLGVAAKTIYNYFSDKDELYLKVLMRGFDILYRDMAAASRSHRDPRGRLRAMARAYVRFGLDNPHYYNVLFNLDLPRFSDYVGTGHETLADLQNRAALRVAVLTREVMAGIPGVRSRRGSKGIDYLLMRLWSSLHGVVSLTNSRVTLEVGDFTKAIDRIVDDAVDICG
ncbi:MAG: TetR/AcrR family transcriptional regulator [Spirochaetes bacterium]|nr:TetR/AcrR family transcriptional regulator [Spirochaetota bacterium]